MEFKDFDIKAAEMKLDADKRLFTGYASTFGNTDSYGDTILPGAYKSVIAGGQMPVMFYGHDWSSIPIGKWLTMQEDEKGLLVTGQLTRGSAKADEVLAALKATKRRRTAHTAARSRTSPGSTRFPLSLCPPTTTPG